MKMFYCVYFIAWCLFHWRHNLFAKSLKHQCNWRFNLTYDWALQITKFFWDGGEGSAQGRGVEFPKNLSMCIDLFRPGVLLEPVPALTTYQVAHLKNGAQTSGLLPERESALSPSSLCFPCCEHIGWVRNWDTWSGYEKMKLRLLQKI